jgi:hypothetical protein
MTSKRAKIATIATVAGLGGLAGAALASNPATPSTAAPSASAPATGAAQAIVTRPSGASSLPVSAGTPAARVVASPVGGRHHRPIVTRASGVASFGAEESDD